MNRLKIYIIYLITDVVTLKHYVGCTTSTLVKRMSSHAGAARGGARTKFARHIRASIGDDVPIDDFNKRFKISEIDSVNNQVAANFYERNYIMIFNSHYDGYNATKSGLNDGTHLIGNKHTLGHKLTHERKQHLSDTHKGSKAYQWQDIDEDKIKNMVKSGISISETARREGLSFTTAWRVVNDKRTREKQGNSYNSH